MGCLCLILGFLGLGHFFEVVKSLPPRWESEAQALFSGLYLEAVAVFTGLCFLGSAVGSRTDRTGSTAPDKPG